MDRGLKAPLSPHEERTLQLVERGTSPQELLPRDIAHLHKLGLIEWHREGLAITALGRQRLGPLSRAPKPAQGYREDEVLPAERAAAQARREADFLEMLNPAPQSGKK
jgi:hypothetical protein